MHVVMHASLHLVANGTFHIRRILETHFRLANQKMEFRNDVMTSSEYNRYGGKRRRIRK